MTIDLPKYVRNNYLHRKLKALTETKKKYMSPGSSSKQYISPLLLREQILKWNEDLEVRFGC